LVLNVVSGAIVAAEVNVSPGSTYVARRYMSLPRWRTDCDPAGDPVGIASVADTASAPPESDMPLVLESDELAVLASVPLMGLPLSPETLVAPLWDPASVGDEPDDPSIPLPPPFAPLEDPH
jgi:hypothetical protein